MCEEVAATAIIDGGQRIRGTVDIMGDTLIYLRFFTEKGTPEAQVTPIPTKQQYTYSSPYPCFIKRMDPKSRPHRRRRREWDVGKAWTRW